MDADRGREWDGYDLVTFDYADFSSVGPVVDVGCGAGLQMEELRAQGLRPLGTEISTETARAARDRGFDVVVGRVEAMPLANRSVGGVLCKVVIPYAVEELAISEIGRILKPGGEAKLVYHGVGYYLRYLVSGSFRTRLYALRTFANTLAYRWFGRRLPGWIGDTTAQSPGRLRRAYRRAGLDLFDAPDSPGFLGFPVFIYHRLRKPPDDC